MERFQRLATVGILYHPRLLGIEETVLDPLRAGATEEGSPEGTAIMEVTSANGDMLMGREGSQGGMPPGLAPPALQKSPVAPFGQPDQKPEAEEPERLSLQG